MSNTTRRDFLRSSAAMAAALSGAASAINAHTTELKPAQSPAQTPPPKPASEIQVPKMKFFGVEISRLILGVNPICGFAHYNNNFGAAMKDWYTPDRVCKVMHDCNRFGINAFNYVHLDPAPQDWARFQAEGGKMHLIMQVIAGDDVVALAKNLKPLAMQRQAKWSTRLSATATCIPSRSGARKSETWVCWLASALTNRKSSHKWKRKAGTSIFTPAVSITVHAQSTSGKKCSTAKCWKCPRYLPAKRSPAHVQSDAPDQKALLRLQGFGRWANFR